MSATRHPNYSDDKDINDIAVIRMRRSIAFNSGVGPICLPFKWDSNMLLKDFFPIKIKKFNFVDTLLRFRSSSFVGSRLEALG